MGGVRRRGRAACAGPAAGLLLGLLVLAGLGLAGAPARAESYTPHPFTDLLPADVRYDAAVPTPREVTGYDVGEIVTPYELLTAYVRAVDAASERVSVEVIGESHLRRPILAVTVTSEANQARLPEICAVQQQALDPLTPPPPDDQPVVVEVVHGAHGDEPSGYDVAPLLLYHLAAAEDAETAALRERAVVTMIVTLNPDGAARAAAWLNAHHANAPVSHPAHRDHDAGFFAGRGNHYGFDLNRQWLPVSQPEAAAVVGWTQDWLPHVVADLHEMMAETSYFVGPGPRAGINPLTSEESFELGRALASAVAAEADAEGRLYVSEEVFDDYYLGYATSYPGLLGSVPLLFEQSTTGGVIVDSPDGLQRYDDKIAEHFHSVLALIDAAAERRAVLSDYQRRYFADSRAKAVEGPVAGYVFTSSDRARLRRFLTLLETHHVEVLSLNADVDGGGYDFAAGDAFVVPVDQPRAALARAIFETAEPAGVTELYDATGWTLSLAYGLDVAALDAGAFQAAVLGAAAGPESLARVAPPPETDYAYVLEWGARYAPRAIHRALDAGLRAKVLPAPAQLRVADGVVDAPRGAVMIPVAEQPLDTGAIHALMVRAAEEDEVTVHAVVSGRTPAGPDLGGFDVAPLETPRVLLVTGRGVDMEEAGEVWRLLDREMVMPVVMVDQPDLTAGLLYDFTHLILVDGVYDDLPDGFASGVASWVRAGGVLTATRGGADWAMHAGITAAQPLGLADMPPAPPALYADKRQAAAANAINGAVFAVALDQTHPIAFGYDGVHSYTHRQGVRAFAPTAGGGLDVVARYAPQPLTSGYASEANVKRLAGAASVVAERRGDGAIVLFADDPLFRGYWLASERMFLNALFYGRAASPDGMGSYR